MINKGDYFIENLTDAVIRVDGSRRSGEGTEVFYKLSSLGPDDLTIDRYFIPESMVLNVKIFKPLSKKDSISIIKKAKKRLKKTLRKELKEELKRVESFF